MIPDYLSRLPLNSEEDEEIICHVSNVALINSLSLDQIINDTSSCESLQQILSAMDDEWKDDSALLKPYRPS